MAAADCLYHRLLALPLVNLGYEKGLEYYEWGAQKSPLFDRVGTMVYGTSQSILGSDTYGRFVQPYAGSAARIACKGLDLVEEKVPAVKASPDQLKTMANEYYEQSVIKSVVQAAVMGKRRGSDTINGNIELVRKQSQALGAQAINTFNGLLNFVDRQLDSYMGKEQIVADHDYAQMAYSDRFKSMGDKFRTLIMENKMTVDQINRCKELVGVVTGNLDQSVNIALAGLDYCKNKGIQAVEGGKGQLESLAVSSCKLWAHGVSQLLASVLSRTGQYLPADVEAHARSLDSYFRGLDDRMAIVHSYPELQNEAANELRSKVAEAQKLIAGILDNYSDWRVAGWAKGKICNDN